MSAFGKDVCEVLGLDPNITRTVTITIEPHCVPVVVAEQCLFDGEKPDGLVSVLRTFDVVERVEAEQ